jgi:hypothetical protein
MPDGMPYHVEKGPTLTLIEKHLNASTLGNKVGILGRMRVQDDADSQTSDWLRLAMPSLWQDATLLSRAPDTRTRIEQAWFGIGDGAGATWVGYSGDVNRIVRRGLRWALEVSLGLTPYDPLPPLPSAPAGAPIELLWICGIHWFETWVIQRPGPQGGRIVTVIFLTPAHEGAVVSTTPLATAATTRSSGAYPVPSREPDYLEVAFPPVDTTAVARGHASWVVTHAQHTPYELLTNNAKGTRLGAQQAPALAYYVGSGGPVVVSPSVPAGGVPRTGTLP